MLTTENKDRIMVIMKDRKKMSYMSLQWHVELVHVPVNDIEDAISSLIDENLLEIKHDHRGIKFVQLGMAT